MVAIHHLSDDHHNESTRLYLQSLMSGVMPDIRAEFGHWEPVVKLAEKAFSEAKQSKQGETVQKLLTSLKKLPRKYPGLKALLEEEPVPLSRKSEQGEESESLMPALPSSVCLPPALAKGACPELDAYVNYSKQAASESWDEYHVFCGIWLFSAINARRSYAQIRAKKFHGNMMLGLCGESSMFGKTTAADVAKEGLKLSGLHHLVRPQKSTPQKLLSSMAGKHVPDEYDMADDEQKERIRKRLAQSGQCAMYHDECGKFIQGMARKNSLSAEWPELLMELDAAPEEFTNDTISRGEETIQQPYVAYLGSMTPANLKEVGKTGNEFWQDGFWARFSFVAAPPATPENVKRRYEPEDDEEEDDDLVFPPELFHAFRCWHERLGIPDCKIEDIPDKKGEKIVDHVVHRGNIPETRVTVTREARKAWAKYSNALLDLCLTLPHKDFNGNYKRLPETAMRMAVLMASLSNHDVIDLKIWAKAQELAEILRKNLHDLYNQVNAGEPGYQRKAEDEVRETIEKLSVQDVPVTAREIGRRLRKLSTGQIRTVLIDLKQSGDIVELPSQAGRTVCYALAQSG